MTAASLSVAPAAQSPVDAPDWAPDSWTRRPAQQQAEYPDRGALAAAVEQIGLLPPLVTSWEI